MYLVVVLYPIEKSAQKKKSIQMLAYSFFSSSSSLSPRETYFKQSRWLLKAIFVYIYVCR